MTHDDPSMFIEMADATPDVLQQIGLSHNPFTALVIPRPIGWISTRSLEGIPNLSPFSFFNAACQSPPMVMFCANAQHVQGGSKDSLLNARETGEFVVNIASWSLRKKLNLSSVTAPREADEFEIAGLTKRQARMVNVPYVAEARAHLECKVLKIVDLTVDEKSPDRNTAVFGRVVGMRIDRDLVVNGQVDPALVDPIARLGYLDYARLGEVSAMPRPAWPLSSA